MIASLRDFLDSDYQAKLRYRCQLNTERFEDTLRCYKKAFLFEWERLQAEIEETSRNPVDDVLFNIPLQDIAEVFDCICEIYISWIDARNQDAHEKLKNLLDKRKWLQKKMDIQDDIFFRARVRTGDFSQWDMYHVPFNKRYMVSNQQYGLTGQPLFYIGSSVLDILYELEGCLTKLNDYSVSSVKFRDRTEVVDFRNRMDGYYQINIPSTAEIEEKDVYDNDNDNELCKALLESILVFCCSFRGRNRTARGAFVEEYVLPQMVAQYLKSREDFGILYSSVKDFPCLELNHNGKIDNIRFRDNVAIFTKYNIDAEDGQRDYDMDLYKKIDISPPVSYGRIYDSVNLNDVQEVCEELSRRQSSLRIIGLKQESMFADVRVSDYDEGDVRYFDSSAG